MKKVLFLAAGPLQVPALKVLKKLGYYVICCDYDKNAVGFEYADKTICVSAIDNEKILEIARHYKPDHIMTSTSDKPVETAAYVCEQLGIPYDLSYEDAICATHKDAMRKRLHTKGVPVPQFFVCTDFEAFREAVVEKLPKPCIVKPVDNAASRGVIMINKVDIQKDKLKTIYEQSKENSRCGDVIVEELMRGPEVSVECLVVDRKVNIIAITDKTITEPPYFVELGHTEQSTLSEDIKGDITRVATAAIKAIGIVNGCSHVEIMVTEQGAKIVELAARLGGDHITSDLVPLSTGINIVEASVRLSLGEKISLRKKKQRGAAIRYIYSNEPGVLSSIIIDDSIKRMPFVKEVEVYARQGESVTTPRSSNDRLGHIIVDGDDAEKAVLHARTAMECVKINLA